MLARILIINKIHCTYAAGIRVDDLLEHRTVALLADAVVDAVRGRILQFVLAVHLAVQSAKDGGVSLERYCGLSLRLVTI